MIELKGSDIRKDIITKINDNYPEYEIKNIMPENFFLKPSGVPQNPQINNTIVLIKNSSVTPQSYNKNSYINTYNIAIDVYKAFANFEGGQRELEIITNNIANLLIIKNPLPTGNPPALIISLESINYNEFYTPSLNVFQSTLSINYTL